MKRLEERSDEEKVKEQNGGRTEWMKKHWKNRMDEKRVDELVE